MQSFILIHSQKTKRDEYLNTYITKQAISPFDVQKVTGESSLGIEEIRDMQKQLHLKPLKGTQKVIILENAQTLTIEAQNAMLKVLEEPPSHTLFFLSTNAADTFLPTILSRCTLITLEEEKQELTSDQISSLGEDLKLLFSDSIANKLSLAEKIASQKDEVGKWLAAAIIYLRQQLINDIQTNQSTNVTMLRNLQEAYRLVTTTNTNPRIVLEHTFLTC